ncbi:MAG: hypothetical protein ACMUIS_09025 [bacterium]
MKREYWNLIVSQQPREVIEQFLGALTARLRITIFPPVESVLLIIPARSEGIVALSL